MGVHSFLQSEECTKKHYKLSLRNSDVLKEIEIRPTMKKVLKPVKDRSGVPMRSKPPETIQISFRRENV